jgi:hypothetical protein
MKEIKIDELLKKFYDGSSTPDEECTLRDFFLSDKPVAEHLETDRLLFCLLQAEQSDIPTAVSERLEAKIRHFRKLKIRRMIRRASAIAAIMLLCTGLFFVTHRQKPPALTDTFDDPAEAAAVAAQALAFMSGQLNKGLGSMQIADYEIKKVNKIVNKYFKE